jgi:hypothetical protein
MSSHTSDVLTGVLVTGDLVHYVSIYADDRVTPSPHAEAETPVQIERTLGGAYRFFQMIEKAQPAGPVSFGLNAAPAKIPSGTREAYTLYLATTGGLAAKPGADKGERTQAVWRIDRLLGYGLLPRAADPEPMVTRIPIEDTASKSVVAIDDEGIGFRTFRAQNRWPFDTDKAAANPHNWIVLKMASPVAKGDLWRFLLHEPYANKLIVVVSADHLRRDGAAVSRGLSWEKTVSELFAALSASPVFSSLLRCRHLVVCFSNEGALWIDNSEKGATAKFIFDPVRGEGEWPKALRDSQHYVSGRLSVFAAAVVAEACRTATGLNLTDALRRGLAATRCLRLHGHGPITGKPQFPFEEVARVLDPENAVEEFAECIVPVSKDRIQDSRGWTIASYVENPSKPDQPLFGLAHQVALYGEPRLNGPRGVPHARFGDLLSVDREEIETLRGLRRMVGDYSKTKQPKAPLSIGAFGPPGAGKSFGIQQIVKEILGPSVPLFVFNLSQFKDANDLIGAFHQVRDKVLEGFVPVAFWDEFDSEHYRWLQFLLAPMQDGKFQSGQLTHSIGKCIFVFAGATSHDFEHFGPMPGPITGRDREQQKRRHADPERQRHDEEQYEEFVLKKGPDFVSRLSGHINVLGPNRRQFFNYQSAKWEEPDTSDITFPVRRAILLRAHFKLKADAVLSIDRDLLRALLLVPGYRHGSRSMEKIVEPMRTSGAPPYRMSHLPPPQVCHQHLDSKEAFDALCIDARQLQTPERLRRMAAAIHEDYERRDAEERRISRKELTEPEFLKVYDNFDDWNKATNLAAAARLSYVLALAGLRLEQCDRAAFAGEEAEITVHLERHLNVLAEEEHILWMAFHVENDWRYLPWEQMDPKTRDRTKDKLNRRHSLLVPFRDLKEHKAKDEQSIKRYPKTAALAGLKIVFMGAPASSFASGDDLPPDVTPGADSLSASG